MPVWGWIVLAILVVGALVAIVWAVWSRQRTQRLEKTFGPEYERTVDTVGDRRKAEAELEARRERRGSLDIRPLAPEDRDRYQSAWRDTQARFVDAPDEAIREADRLVIEVMKDRGYPVDDFDQRAEDVSVDHPQVVEDYRAAHAISIRTENGEASTEDLRQAMVHYRSLFEELLVTEEPRKVEQA